MGSGQIYLRVSHLASDMCKESVPHLCSFRVAASHTLIMASPPALHKYTLHMASACTVLQCASAELLHTSGTPRWAGLPRGRTCPLLGACSASLLGRKPLMVASCVEIEQSAHDFTGGQHQHIFSCFLEMIWGSNSILRIRASCRRVGGAAYLQCMEDSQDCLQVS